MSPLTRALAVVMLLGFIGMMETARAAPRDTRPHVVRPSGSADDSAAIQQAIDRARDGETIRFGPGVFRIGRPLQVAGKRLTLTGNGGSGRRRTEFAGPASRDLEPADRAEGLVNYEARGGGVLERMLLRGGANGIVAHDRDGTTAALVVDDTVITQTGRGILWSSDAALTVRRTTVVDVSSHGIVVVKATQLIVISYTAYLITATRHI